MASGSVGGVEGNPLLSDAAKEGGQVVREAEHVAAGDLRRDVDVPVVLDGTTDLGEAGCHDFAGAAGGLFLVEGGVADGVGALAGDGLGFGEGQPVPDWACHGAGQQQAQEGKGEADHGAAWAWVASFRWW